MTTFLVQGIRPATWWEKDRASKATRTAIRLCVLLLAPLGGMILLLRQRRSGMEEALRSAILRADSTAMDKLTLCPIANRLSRPLRPHSTHGRSQTSSDAHWPRVEKYFRRAFWGTNVGLAMTVVTSLFAGGVLQVWDVLQNGYWHARSLDYIGTERSAPHRMLRMPGDVVFIVFGAVPLVIAAIKSYWNLRARPRGDKVGLRRPA